MTAEPRIDERTRELIDAYLDGTLDQAGFAQLESLVASDPALRRYFARYAQTHTDLAFEVAALTATERALAQIPESEASSSEAMPAEGTSAKGMAAPVPRTIPALALRPVRWLVAASLLVGMSIGGGVVGLFAAQATAHAPTPLVPRTISLSFRDVVADTLADGSGVGTGFTTRLPGTGAGVPARDPNLRVAPEAGQFELRPTASDLNTRFRVEQAEFPGVRLADLGFTGAEDFEVQVTAVAVPELAFVGQFGIYAGSSSDWAVRGGLVSQREPDSYRQFLVNTRDGRDKDAYFVGLGAPGDDLRIRLARSGGKFTMSVENRTSGATSSLAIRHPEFLDGRSDLVVGLFACEPRGNDHQPVRFADFSATVWALPKAR